MMRLLTILQTDAAKLIIAAIAAAVLSFIFGPDTAGRVFDLLLGG